MHAVAPVSKYSLSGTFPRSVANNKVSSIAQSRARIGQQAVAYYGELRATRSIDAGLGAAGHH